MLIYKNTFENTKTINIDFPIEDQYYADEKEAIVADGITRDPIGVVDLNSYTFRELVERYPRPSGAYLASLEIVNTFKNTKGTLRERLIKCNENIKKLNNKYIQKCDYLENDYYASVASCIEFKDNIMYYAYICDCGIIVYDKNGNIKFQTEDDKKLYSDPYIDKIGIPWNLPEARVKVRKEYRNNLNNIQDGKCVSYGAITGEDNALEFIKYGSIELSNDDIIVLYSDGISNFLHEEDFINQLLNFNEEEFERYITKKSESDYNKYGSEKTLILYRYMN